ncbi:MAG: TonB-dependent receptor, partial [Acidobacteria bacterium]|nr:TonB-dependent receptor [Acidobacteriota bacterium]
IGADGEKTKVPSANFTTGTPSDPSFCPTGAVCGATFTFSGFDAAGARIPFQQNVAERAAAVNREGTGFAFYVQDQWRPINQLTVNLGVRYDTNNYYNNQDIKVLDFKKFQPRLSAAFDVFGDGKTSIRANYGLFYVDAALTLARLFDSGITSPVTRTYQWSTTQNRWNFLRSTGGQFLTSALIDGELKATYDTQYNFAVEREIVRGLSTSISYINKETHDIYEDSCINQTECPDFWLTNQPGRDIGLNDYLYKKYKGVILQSRYTFTRGIVDASYTWSKSQGTIDSSVGQYAADDADYFPYNFTNRDGYLADDARNRFKVFGSYRVPFIETDFVVNYTYRSGAPYNVTVTQDGLTVFAVARGTDRTKILHNVDFEVRKEIPLSFIKSGFSATVIGTVLNLTNSEQPTTYSTNGNVGANPPARTPTAYQRPRNYQSGFRMDF